MDLESAVLEKPALDAIEDDGYAFFEGVFSHSEVDDLAATIGRGLEAGGDAVRSRAGVPYAARNALDICPEISQLWRHPLLVAVVTKVLGNEAGLVRALYLNKPPGDSWAVPWHKDVIVPVSPGETESTVFSTPTDRAGVPHAEAPLSVLRNMLTLRIHLDDNTDENGSLRVLSGSHKSGKELTIDGFPAFPVYAQAGDVLVLRPLLAHKSGHAREGSDAQRRVLQLQFSASSELPDNFRWVNFEPVM